MFSLNQELRVSPWRFNPKQHYLSSIVVEADFLMKKRYVIKQQLMSYKNPVVVYPSQGQLL